MDPVTLGVIGTALVFGYLATKPTEAAAAQGSPGQPPQLPPNLPGLPGPPPNIPGPVQPGHIPGAEQSLASERGPDGTVYVKASFAALAYGTYKAMGYMLTSDPSVVEGTSTLTVTNQTLGAWCDQVIASGSYVLLLMDPSRTMVRRAAATDLGLARANPAYWAVLFSPAQQQPAQVPGVPGGAPLPPFPNNPGIPGLPNPAGPMLPASIATLPPELQAQVAGVYQNGTARELKDLGQSLAKKYPQAATDLRNKAAERAEIEKIKAAQEGRVVKILAGKYPSYVAQHYNHDATSWPELTKVNPYIDRKGNNLVPWKTGADLVLPSWWDFEREPMIAEAPAPKPAPNPEKKAVAKVVAGLLDGDVKVNMKLNGVEEPS